MSKSKVIIPIVAVLIVLAIAAAGYKFFILDAPIQPEEPVESVEPTHEIILPTQVKTSYLFRDDILGRNKDDVMQTLDIEEDEVVSENILSRNVETTYKWNNASLEAVYSTISVDDVKGYNYARNHQTAVDEAISSTGAIPESKAIWKSGYEMVYDNNLWNSALEEGELTLIDRFDTEQGSLLIITCNKKFDDGIKRSRTEKVFTSVIIGESEYIDGLISNVG